mmetsp:Transcript_1209/g.2752  ORF Transcript_1209/g.2752 Transcript_1209/m.2752 type:complete len:157 (-) Transcript_1209:55-525(-)
MASEMSLPMKFEAPTDAMKLKSSPVGSPVGADGASTFAPSEAASRVWSRQSSPDREELAPRSAPLELRSLKVALQHARLQRCPLRAWLKQQRGIAADLAALEDSESEEEADPVVARRMSLLARQFAMGLNMNEEQDDEETVRRIQMAVRALATPSA